MNKYSLAKVQLFILLSRTMYVTHFSALPIPLQSAGTSDEDGEGIEDKADGHSPR